MSKKLEAFKKITPVKESIKSHILSMIVNKSMTYPEMLKKTGYKIQTLTARLSDLELEGKIYTIDKGGKYSYFVMTPKNQIKKRKKAKLQERINQLETTIFKYKKELEKS